MKSIKGILCMLVLALCFSLGCEKENKKVEAEIIGFVTEKCACCWGWEIKVGNDTIKADSLPYNVHPFSKHYPPIPVLIEIGKKKLDCSWQEPAYHFDYYEIKSLEIIE